MVLDIRKTDVGTRSSNGEEDKLWDLNTRTDVEDVKLLVVDIISAGRSDRSGRGRW